MGYPLTGETGYIDETSANTDLYYLFHNAIRVNKDGATLNINGSSVDVTAAAASGINFKSHMGGLRDATIDFNGYFPKTSPLLGIGSLITFASGTVNRVQSWDLDLEWPEVDITQIAGANNSYRQYMPGGIGMWRVNWTCLQDSSTAPTLPVVGNSPAAITLKMSENGTTDSTLSGSVLVDSYVQTIKMGEKVTNVYKATGSGDLTQLNGGLFSASNVAITKPIWDTNSDGTADGAISLYAASGRVWTGPAFWTKVKVKWVPGDPITVTGTLRFSDALTAVG